MDVWEFYEMIDAASDRSHLNEAERRVAAICDLRQEVNSGGFDSYFRYWGGDTATLALASIGQLLGAPWAEVLGEAMDLIGRPYPTSVTERERRLDDVGLSEPLDALDQRFFDLEAVVDADRILSEHLARIDGSPGTKG